MTSQELFVYFRVALFFWLFFWCFGKKAWIGCQLAALFIVGATSSFTHPTTAEIVKTANSLLIIFVLMRAISHGQARANKFYRGIGGLNDGD